MNQWTTEHMREIGSKGGRSKSLAKRLAAQANGKKRRKMNCSPSTAATSAAPASKECGSADGPKNESGRP